MARQFLAAVERGEEPWKKPEAPKGKLTLGNLLDNFYTPWVAEHRRSGLKTVNALKSAFAWLMLTPAEEITVADVEEWRIKKRNEKGSKGATLNRLTIALKAAINWALKRELIEKHPLSRLEKLREDDSDTKLRYLTPEERERLYAALDAREERMKAERDSHNEWLTERNEPLFPDLKKYAFVDHLKPMIITTLNSGIRRGALFQLLWSDINFQEGILTVRPAINKITKGKGKIIHIPMTPTLTNTLVAWKEQTGGDGDGLVFPSPKTGTVMDNCKTAWARLLKDADIKKFRWHDMRHDFASQLVTKGVDLNTVRELLGHADIKMTLRYAHLAPENKLRAVERLDRKK
jgi:integrase